MGKKHLSVYSNKALKILVIILKINLNNNQMKNRQKSIINLLLINYMMTLLLENKNNKRIRKKNKCKK